MSDIIRLLPDSVANQIAAGEVVQRPASVVKELLENSIDAGATEIQLLLTDAGKSCIQVVDNGKGMSETDARLSFERHATSKITSASDLFNLRTMGFRGEALASIAAVAQVELQTRTNNNEMGVSITMEGPRCVDQHPVVCKVGANFKVRNLFYNVPARRRFLKSNITEMNNIMHEFERVALINPGISFKLFREDVLNIDLPAGSFKQRIVNLFGAALDKQLLPLSVDTDVVRVEGFVAYPQNAKVKGFKQFMFVNGRYMKHPYFNKAVLSAYDRLIPPEKQISFFICLNVDPQQIDVNIHPSKTEIKFDDDRTIWQILLSATRDALGKYNTMPVIDFDNSMEVDIPSFRSDNKAAEPQPSIHRDYNPFESLQEMPHYKHSEASGWQSLYDFAKDKGSKTQPTQAMRQSAPTQQDLYISEHLKADESANSTLINDMSMHSFIQYGERYIVTAVHSGLMIIDYVRAHRRILYDKFMLDLQKGDAVSQALLFPDLLQLDVTQSYIMDALLKNLTEFGFDISPIGNGAYAINGVPAAASNINANSLITKLIEDYDKEGLKASDLYHKLAYALAVGNAVAANSTLDVEQMTHIIDSLFACETPNYSPDGKLIISVIAHNDIARLFN